MRVRVPIPAFLAILATLVIGAVTGAVESTRPTPDEIQRRIEDLFIAARYDSILNLIPPYIERAGAEHDSVLLGRLLAERGHALLVTGRRDEGVHDIELALQMAQALRDTLGWMPAIHYRGFAYAIEGRYADAARCVEERLRLAQIVHSPLDEAWARSTIAYMTDMRGDHAAAKQEYTRSIMLFREGGRPVLEATPLIGLGRSEAAMGNESEAKRCYQRAWVVAREGGDRVNEMWAVNNLGVMEWDADPGRAIGYLQRAYDIAREINFPRAMVVPALNLSEWAQDLGDFARSEAILTEAKEVCRAQGARNLLNMVDFSLADLRLDEGRYQAAGAIYRRLLATPGTLEPQHKDFAVIGLAKVLANNDSIPQAIAMLKNNFEAKGANVYASSEPEANLLLSHLHGQMDDPEGALHYARRALERAQNLGWRRVPVTARLRESVCCRALGRRAEAHASLVAGLDSLDAARGGIATTEWREIYGQDTARDVLDAGQILLEYPDELPAAAREKAFFDSMQRFKTRSLLDRIGEPRAEGGPGAARALPHAATIDELQRGVLRPGELLLECFVGSEESYLAAVTTDDLRLVKLPGPDSPLAESVDLYHRVLASADAGLQADFPPGRLASVQRSIGSAVLRGVSGPIADAQRVFVAPDGFFAAIPFGTLMLDDLPGMLMETKDVVQIPSASVLVLQRSRPGKHDGALRLVALEAAEDLPGAHSEVGDLSRRYAGVERVRGVDGGAEEFASIAARCDVLHIAAHALAIDHSPWQSGLMLAADVAAHSAAAPSAESTRSSTHAIEVLSSADSALVAREFQADPFVRAWQIARMSLPTRLTVLAGCETAGGRLTTGEGVLGLTAAFMSAGVPVVVASLWPVDDRATARIMRSFYQHLADGETVATALRRAQLDARTGGQSHPFYWAGFTVVGDGSLAVDIERASRLRPVLVSSLALALVVTALALYLKRRSHAQTV